MAEIAGSVMIVTGASSGIGEATARLAGAQGARLVLAARRTDRLERLVQELPQAVAVTTDMRDPHQVARMVDTALGRYGRVDVLVNNAGQGYHVPVEDITLDDFQAVIELNVYGALGAMQAVLPIMRRQRGGSIINVSSGTVRGAWPGVAPYAASKAALTHLSRVARNEWASDGVVVSTIFPYVTATAFHQVLRAGEMRQPASSRGRPPAHPPDLVARAILQLVRTGEEEAVLTPT